MTTKQKKSESKEVLCVILDAVYKEDLGTEEDPTYNNSIFMRLQDTETKSIFTSNLTAEEVQSIVGSSRQMSSMEMIHFAKELRQRDEPVRLLVPKNAKIVTPEIIKDGQKLDASEEEIDLEKDTPIAGKYIDKFSIKNTKEIENEG